MSISLRPPALLQQAALALSWEGVQRALHVQTGRLAPQLFILAPPPTIRAFRSMPEISLPPTSPLRVALPPRGKREIEWDGRAPLSASPPSRPAVIASAFSCPPPAGDSVRWTWSFFSLP